MIPDDQPEPPIKERNPGADDESHSGLTEEAFNKIMDFFLSFASDVHIERIIHEG